MPETYKEWGQDSEDEQDSEYEQDSEDEQDPEEEQHSCSSCNSLHSVLSLESSDDTEIVTIGEERVPGVPSEIDRLFLLERILGSYQLALECLRLGQEDGGASDPVPQDTQDEDKAQDTQDTQDTQDKHL